MIGNGRIGNAAVATNFGYDFRVVGVRHGATGSKYGSMRALSVLCSMVLSGLRGFRQA
jgi:hypothetical protein